MKKQYMLMYILVVLLMAGCSNAEKTTEEQGYQEDPTVNIAKDEILLYIQDQSTTDQGDLYVKTSKGDREKIGSKVAPHQFVYLYNTKALLFLDKDNNLIVKEAGKPETQISTDVYPNSWVVSQDETTVLFLKTATADDFSGNTGDLYRMAIGSEKEKIASNIKQDSYSLTKDGKIATFMDAESSLYRKASDVTDKEKLASSISKFIMSNDGDVTVFENLDGSVYIKKVNMPDKEKLASQNIYELTFSDDSQIMAYLDEYHADSSKGELMLLIDGYEKTKIASDIIDYQIPVLGDSIYFLNEDKSLYVKTIKDTEEDEKSKKKNKDEDQPIALKTINPIEKVKLDDEVTDFDVTPDGSSIIYLDTDENLFLKRIGEQKVKIGSNVINIHLYNDSILFRDKENTLYTIDLTLDSVAKKALEKVEKSEQPSDRAASPVKDKVKLADEVEAYSTDKSLKYLVYKVTSGELYVRTKAQPTPVKVFENMDEFSALYFLNYLLYEKLVTINSLEGYWKTTDKETGQFMYSQFTKDSKVVWYNKQGESTEQSFTLKNATARSVELTFSDDSIVNFDLINKDTLALHVDGETAAQELTRVNKEEVDKNLIAIKDKIAAEAKEATKSTALTADDAIKVVESLDPGNYSADHDSSEYDITTVDGAFFFYINYSAASGMGGGLFVRQGTGEVFGYTMGTEDDPNAPFPDFTNQIR